MSHLESMMKDITFLSSPEAAGRLSATEGAKVAAAYLQQELEAAGFQPKGTNGYYDPVQVPAARLLGPVELVIGDKVMRHRIDFGEMGFRSAGADLETELFVLRDGDDIDPAALAGKAVLIPEQPEDFDVAGTLEAAVEMGIKVLMVEYGEPKWFRKGLVGNEGNKIPMLQIRTSVAKELATYHGQPVKLNLPLVTSTMTCQNVLGYLENPGAEQTLVLTAHYDHLGDDPQGQRYPGTIDNATGVALVMEAARVLAKSPEALPFNLLVAFLTGEESSLWGANHLADNPPVPLTAVINVDSLGFERELVALRTGHDEPGHWLPDFLATIIEENGVDVRWIAGGDDSWAFLNKGIPVVSIGQKPTMEDSISIHTPDDHLGNLNTQPVEKGFHIFLTLLQRLAQEDLIRQHSLETVRD